MALKCCRGSLKSVLDVLKPCGRRFTLHHGFRDPNYDFLWQVKDSESSITAKPFPDSPNDLIKDDTRLFSWGTFFPSAVRSFARSEKGSFCGTGVFSHFGENCADSL